MKYGDEDGYNSIYDGNGDPILHPKERVLTKEEAVVPTLKSTWRYYGGEYLIDPSKGTLYLTNERMIFINIPERMVAIGGGDQMRAMSSSSKMGTSFSLGDLAPEATIREYFDIPNIEIMASERKEGAVSVGLMVNVYILSSGNQYHLSMVLDEESDLLKRLMNKSVRSSDELVKNLKDFFKRTDWMFLEAEKGLYDDVIAQQPEEEIPEKEAPARRPVLRSPKPAPQPSPRQPAKPISRHINKRLESKSLEYFENLYSKGLITEDIYRRLMKEYGLTDSALRTGAKEADEKERASVPAREPIQDTGLAPEQVTGEKAYPEADISTTTAGAQTETTGPAGGAEGSDEDLIGMLSDTLSDISETPQEAPGTAPGTPSPPPEEPVPAPEPTTGSRDTDGPGENISSPSMESGGEAETQTPEGTPAKVRTARKVKQLTVKRT